jgi:hypothetical protein
MVEEWRFSDSESRSSKEYLLDYVTTSADIQWFCGYPNLT